MFQEPAPLEALRRGVADDPVGLYIHVPFCVDRCTYCSFCTTRDRTRQPEALARLAEDMARLGEALAHPQADTLYLGGGTPSVLTLAELGHLTEVARRAFLFDGLREATLEANPGTVDLAWLAGARRLGWDRISLGLQTLDDGLLGRLGRVHDAREGLLALRRAGEAGFERISADLMIGIPGQDLARVLSDARDIAEAGASHLSVYMLDLDKPCPLKTEVDEGRLSLPSEDEVADAFEALQEHLPKLGFMAYEISNYARPGQESIHNTRYWERRPYLGFGPSAASHVGAWRWTETADMEAWIAGSGDREAHKLEAAEVLAEIPLLGLRMLRGVDWAAVRAKAASLNLEPLALEWEHQLEPFIQQGWLVREGSVLKFSRKGLLLSNAVLEIFV